MNKTNRYIPSNQCINLRHIQQSECLQVFAFWTIREAQTSFSIVQQASTYGHLLLLTTDSQKGDSTPTFFFNLTPFHVNLYFVRRSDWPPFFSSNLHTMLCMCLGSQFYHYLITDTEMNSTSNLTTQDRHLFHTWVTYLIFTMVFVTCMSMEGEGPIY